MKLSEWRRLKQLENENYFHRDLNIGDKFLYGLHQIGQMDKKQVGDDISYYTVLNIKDKSCEYVLSFDKLETL